MSGRVKNSIYTLLVLGLILAVWYYRNNSEESSQRQQIGGSTMGTSYSIIYFGEALPNLQFSVDSLLEVFNHSLNTWEYDSEVSLFNRNENFEFELPYFFEVLKSSRKIYDISNGAFDPTVMPLVNAWGFGPEKGVSPDSSYVDSLMNMVGFDKIQFDREKVTKTNTGIQLDFSAIAKGQGVDVVSELLSSLGIDNHFVEIGGEVRCRGINMMRDQEWLIGITDPRSTLEETRLYATLSISDKAVATSGNYYNYRIKDGVRYSHTINPKTGFPIELSILSATVVANNCMDADALATSFMVMGHEEAIEIIDKNDFIEAYLLYSGKEGEIMEYISPGLIGLVKSTVGQ